ncbi:uncharacterized protein LOC115979332 [Quercus lobata]|uniref:Uncharacterized protein n=1 Tax=Quercus lobata TaxID=97700 RepID=A0A7N2R218_QUELO|nr:uncharacterized protein LOC115979332 [Quercus lobata]
MPRTANQFQGMDGTSEVPESLDEWEQIQSPFPKLPPTSVEQDMVVTRDNNYLNDNHEGLQQEVPPVLDLELEATQDPDPESSSSSSVSSNSGGDEENGRLSQPQVANEIRRSLRLRLEILRAGFSKVACRVWNCAACARGFWSIASVTGVAAAVLLSFLYVRVQRWRQVLYKESKDRLIREKDEKIGQLLLHIAQMNEAFSERRRVPVFRIG